MTKHKHTEREHIPAKYTGHKREQRRQREAQARRQRDLRG